MLPQAEQTEGFKHDVAEEHLFVQEDLGDVIYHRRFSLHVYTSFWLPQLTCEGIPEQSAEDVKLIAYHPGTKKTHAS